jgi:hypothetical protein
MSNKQLYQKNVFLQKSKDKFNPDVLKKKDDVDKNRKINVFKKSNTTYNSITNHTPESIKSQKDLELQKDSVIQNLESIIMQKKKEREEQEIQLKPQKQKIIIDENSEQKKIQDFNEMKEEQTEYLNTHKKVVEDNKNRYEDILSNLKNLGILNN